TRARADAADKRCGEAAKQRARPQAEEGAGARILDALLPRGEVPASGFGFGNSATVDIGAEPSAQGNDSETRAKLRRRLRAGELDEREIELELAANVGVDIMTPPGMEEMGQQLRQMFSNLGGGRTSKRRMTLADRNSD